MKDTFTIAVHSPRGGTGKTSVAINLACAYAKEGRDVCLLDMDLKSPSTFNGMFPYSDKWVNDILDHKKNIQEVIVDGSKSIGSEGSFYVGYSNPDISAIREFSSKDRKWQSDALKELIRSKKNLQKEGFDIVIMDTSPGVDFTSANVVAASDYVLMVVKPNEYCLKNIKQAIDGIYTPLGKKCGIVENMCLNGQSLQMGEKYGVPVLSTIPCMCEVSMQGLSKIFTVEEPSHPFSSAIDRLKGSINY
ncbi:ParA family protein [Methanohalophilus sp. RSK]|uniref:ParA family protein n=1 Tax=Methanohalophilus sp. RSK TaxID=2485783 RepID=UPI000F43BB20|nr:ParA family protein [Methanohalophilus sp. RSK]RNI15922.1 ParA family protein [Methanohalophilus sp. RSK]